MTVMNILQLSAARKNARTLNAQRKKDAQHVTAVLKNAGMPIENNWQIRQPRENMLCWTRGLMMIQINILKSIVYVK